MFDKIWNQEADDFLLGGFAPVPKGYTATRCPDCGSRYIRGAIICYPDGKPTNPSGNEDDPNLLCLNCGFWDDAFRNNLPSGADRIETNKAALVSYCVH